MHIISSRGWHVTPPPSVTGQCILQEQNKVNTQNKITVLSECAGQEAAVPCEAKLVNQTVCVGVCVYSTVF